MSFHWSRELLCAGGVVTTRCVVRAGYCYLKSWRVLKEIPADAGNTWNRTSAPILVRFIPNERGTLGKLLFSFERSKPRLKPYAKSVKFVAAYHTSSIDSFPAQFGVARRVFRCVLAAQPAVDTTLRYVDAPESDYLCYIAAF